MGTNVGPGQGYNPLAQDVTSNTFVSGGTNAQQAFTGTAPSAPGGVAGTMDAATQVKTFGFSDPPLPNYGIDPVVDNALNQVKGGISPYDFRVLDAWTGGVHWNEQLPNGTVPVVDYIWTYMLDKSWKWAGAGGQFTSAPTWAPPIPAAALVTGSQTIAAHQPPAPSVPPSSATTPAPTNPNPTKPGSVLKRRQYNPGGGGPSGNVGTISTATVPPSGGTNTGAGNTGNAANLPSLVAQIIAMANGSNPGAARDGVSVLLNWDQWSFYYSQVSNKALPGPETFGLARNTAGLVLVNQQTVFNGAVFAASVNLMNNPAPGTGTTPAGGTSGTTTTTQQATASGYDWLKVLIGGYQGKS